MRKLKLTVHQEDGTEQTYMNVVQVEFWQEDDIEDAYDGLHEVGAWKALTEQKREYLLKHVCDALDDRAERVGAYGVDELLEEGEDLYDESHEALEENTSGT